MCDRVECEYPRTSMVFQVDSGVNTNYFASLIEYEDEDGDLARVDLQQGLDLDMWVPMQRSWVSFGNLITAWNYELLSQSG